MSPSVRAHAPGFSSIRGSFTRCFITAFAALTLCSGAFIGMLFTDVNRQAYLWDRSDTLALFGGLALAAVVLCAAVDLLNRATRGAFSRRASHLLFLVAAMAAMQLLPPKIAQNWGSDDLVYACILFAGLMLTAWSATRPGNRILPALHQGFQLMAVVPILLMINLLRTPPLMRSADFPLTALGIPATNKPPVVIFCFDSIAWIDCMDPDGRMRKELPRMREFQNAAVDFPRAISPGNCTTISIPNMLYQRDPADYSDAIWNDAFLKESPTAFTNGLYYSAKQSGYRTSLIGIYLPYKQMFGELLDHATVYPFDSYALSRDFGSRLFNHLLCIVRFFRGPFPERWAHHIPHLRATSWAHDQYYVRLNRHLIGLANDFLGQSMGAADFLYVDIPIPHFPFVFLADGTFSRAATYETQMQYADRVFGSFLDAMRAADLYDRSWIVFTSDHGEDNVRNVEKNRVPLIIKPPDGFGAACRSSTVVSMWQMGPFFQAVFQGRPAKECLALLTGDEYIYPSASEE